MAHPTAPTAQFDMYNAWLARAPRATSPHTMVANIAALRPSGHALCHPVAGRLIIVRSKHRPAAVRRGNQNSGPSKRSHRSVRNRRHPNRGKSLCLDRGRSRSHTRAGGDRQSSCALGNHGTQDHCHGSHCRARHRGHRCGRYPRPRNRPYRQMPKPR